MILRFHTSEALPGEYEYINICTNPENYNFTFCNEPYRHYIEVSREDLVKIYEELDFNMFWYSEDLTASHETIAAQLEHDEYIPIDPDVKDKKFID